MSASLHYIGIDVGTGSARACVMDENGDIKGLASENIGLWLPNTGFYVSSTFAVDPWNSRLKLGYSQHYSDAAAVV
jgi:ribulose kinase